MRDNTRHGEIIDNNSTVKTIERSSLKQPYNKIRLSQIVHDIKAIAGIIGAPNPSIGLWIYKTEVEPVVFDEKKITSAKYTPCLLLAIKALTFKKEWDLGGAVNRCSQE